jgi:transcriptional regulator with XRE-family HTH domain
LTNQNREWLKTQILRKYLSGLSQEQIANEFDISEGLVSAFLQESRELDPSLMLQHEIAVSCNKSNIPIQELASNLAFSNALKRMAFEHNKIGLLLRTLNKIIVQDGSFLPEKIASLILQICNFMEANGCSLEETHKITEEKSKQLSELKTKIIESKKNIVKTEKARIEALYKKRVTWGKLRQFSIYKKAFELAAFDFKNFKQITNLLMTIHTL